MGVEKSRKSEIFTWLVRWLVGGVFVISGFVKAVDPWGLLYKSDEYLNALSIEIWPNLQLVGVFGLSALEFLVGIFLLFGCFRRSVAVIAALLMCFMLPLTLWLAVDEPVKDCGCFGDAFIISNWASFWKNIVLSIGVAWLLKFNRSCSWLVTPALQWIAFLISGVMIIAVEFFGYMSQPLLDFRPYVTGTHLIDSEQSEADKDRYVFIYEKDGEKKEIGEDEELPDESSGWVFVDRRLVDNGQEQIREDTSSRNLRIWSKDGNDDVTEEVIKESGKELILMIPDLKEVSPATTWKINSLFEWSEVHSVDMIGVVSGTPSEIADWEDLSMASYPIYTADDTQIKEVVRGNPGIVYLIDGVVEWKSTLTALNIDDFMSPEIADDARSFGIDNMRLLYNGVWTYVIVMTALVFLSFLPKIKKYYFRPIAIKQDDESEETIHDDTVHP